MTAANNDASPMDGAPVIDFDKFKPTRSFTSARKRKDFAMKALISCAFIVALIPLFSVLLTTIINGVKRLNLNFLSYNMTGVVGGNPTPSGGYGGILHAIIGTLEITFGAFSATLTVGQSTPFITGVETASALWFFGIALLVSLFSHRFGPRIVTAMNRVCGAVVVLYGVKLLADFVMAVL